MKGVYVFLAEGFEDIEALATVDVLRRGGVDVTTVSVTDDLVVTSSHGISVCADMAAAEFLNELDGQDASFHGLSVESDFLIFPGGMPGTKNLAATPWLMELMNEHYAAGGSLAAICAAPGFVLSQLEGIRGVRFTAYDGCETPSVEAGGIYVREGVVRDGRIITGRGAGWAVPFGLEILSAINGPEKAAAVKAALML